MQSRISLADLAAAKKAVAQIASKDPDVVGYGPQYARSVIAVDVVKANPTTVAALARSVSPRVTVEIVTGASHGSTTSRYYDTRPYYGGNLIKLAGANDGAFCSTAFNLTNSSDGYAYAVTAGHCYQQGNNNTRPDVSIMRDENPDRASGLGKVWTVSTNANGTSSTRHGDLAIYRYTPLSGISASSMGAAVVFTGNGNTTSTRTVVGTKDLPEGYHSAYIRTSGASGYVSGANTGEISPDWVSLVDHTHTYGDGFTVKDVTVVEDASECVSHGDSGGAVYEQYGSTGAWALGVISGNNGQGGGITNCRNYYTPVKYIYFGGSVKTS